MPFRRKLAWSLSIAIGFQSPTQAACLNGHPTVEQEFSNAEFVIIGKTTSVKTNIPVWLRYAKGYYDSRAMIQTVKIEKQYKGLLRQTITYRDEYSSGQFPMSLRTKYVLFYNKTWKRRTVY